MSRGLPRYLAVVSRPSWICGSCWLILPDVREWSGGPLEYPGVAGRPSRMSRSGWENLLDIREWWGGMPDVREW